MNQLVSFFRWEPAGGVLLLIAAVLAMLLANSPWESYYQLLLSTPVEVRVANLEVAKPMLLWINDGLMAIFFLLVGLELKRELLEGGLSNRQQIVLPAVGAVGGMFVPAAFYCYFNYDDPIALQGWAIPAATDIAFALGILTLLGSRVPNALKVFLVSLAIFDDVGAIVIIALFYTSKVSVMAIVVVAFCIICLVLLNRAGVCIRKPYLLIGVVMWVAMLKSGVHATLAGILLALALPMRNPKDNSHSPLKALEHSLHGFVTFVVLPIFAFANAGVNLAGTGLSGLLHSVPIGITLGLFLGKQIGIFGCCWFALRLGWAKLPLGVSLLHLYGASLLCGIGFTMSLFIGSLAFEETGVNLLFDERLGILVGSLVSGIAGFILLNATLPAKENSSH